MLKQGVLLSIQSQEHLNLLSEMVDGVEEDAILIDEEYVAFFDEVLWIIPLTQIEPGHFMSGVKPRKFMPWYRKEKK